MLWPGNLARGHCTRECECRHTRSLWYVQRLHAIVRFHSAHVPTHAVLAHGQCHSKVCIPGNHSGNRVMPPRCPEVPLAHRVFIRAQAEQHVYSPCTTHATSWRVAYQLCPGHPPWREVLDHPRVWTLRGDPPLGVGSRRRVGIPPVLGASDDGRMRRPRRLHRSVCPGAAC